MSFYDFIFVYGTLRQGMNNPLHEDLNRLTSFHQKGSVKADLYLIADYPGLVLNPDSESEVTGDVLKFARRGPLLAKLDDYEGCGPRSPRPHPYVRQRMDIALNQTRTLEAWVYVYVADITGKNKIPGGDFARHMRLMQGQGHEPAPA